jgi:hypothetical protein
LKIGRYIFAFRLRDCTLYHKLLALLFPYKTGLQITPPKIFHVDVACFLWHNPAIKRVDGNEYICRTAREPVVGAKQVSEADGKSSRSVELNRKTSL